MIKGIKVTLGDREFILPPISIGQLRNGVLDKIKEHDRLVQEGQPFEAYLAKTEIIGEALRRNYADLTDSDLDELIDLGNVNDIWQIALGVTGLNMGGQADASVDPTTSGLSTEPSGEPSTGP